MESEYVRDFNLKDLTGIITVFPSGFPATPEEESFCLTQKIGATFYEAKYENDPYQKSIRAGCKSKHWIHTWDSAIYYFDPFASEEDKKATIMDELPRDTEDGPPTGDNFYLIPLDNDGDKSITAKFCFESRCRDVLIEPSILAQPATNIAGPIDKPPFAENDCIAANRILALMLSPGGEPKALNSSIRRALRMRRKAA